MQSSLEHMLDGYAVLRAVREAGEIVDFEWEYVNAIGALTYGRPADEIIGRRLRDLVPDVVEAGVFDERRAVVETGEPQLTARLEYVSPRVDGIFDSRAWKHGDGYAILWRDVTEIAAAQAALRDSHERFRSAVEHLPDAVSVFEAVRDDAGEIIDFAWIHANPAAAVISGHRAEDLQGGRLLELLPDHGRSGMFDVYRRVVETGEPYVEETLWYEDVWGDGERRRRAFDVRATKAADGFVVVTREVTRVREMAERDRLRFSLRSAEQERCRWARELHDSTLQNLAALRLGLSTARGNADRDAVDAVIGETIEHLSAEMADLRALLTELRPAALDDCGVAAALMALGERATALYGLAVAVDVDLGAEDRRLDPELETAIYRLVQEALTNVCKHADAARADIAVCEAGGTVRIIVADDGKGFEPAQADEGFGIIGMRERCELAGGQIAIRSAPAGTTVSVVLPSRERTADGSAAVVR
jgi:PAS domain S-box-containing protein